MLYETKVSIKLRRMPLSYLSIINTGLILFDLALNRTLPFEENQY